MLKRLTTMQFLSLPKAIGFAEQVLVMNAVKDKTTVIACDQDWSIRLEKAIEMNDTVRNLIIAKMQNPQFRKVYSSCCLFVLMLSRANLTIQLVLPQILLMV